MRIAFCGGCNPHIDRERLARALADDEHLQGSDVVIYISGCQRSCRTGRRLALDRTDAVVVAGEYLDGVAVPEHKLAKHVRRAVERAQER